MPAERTVRKNIRYKPIMSLTPNEIFLTTDNKRMGMFHDYKLNASVERIFNGKLQNAKNFDLDDWIDFESNMYGWVEARIIRIMSCPNVKDEYELEFTLEDGVVVKEFEEGRYL